MRRLSRYGWRAAEPVRRPVLFVNPRSGGGRAAQAGLVERASERGINALVLGPHQDLAALVDEAVADGADALGMAGGDGSLGVVAAAAQAHGLPFVCVPAGTRNHFALDLGVDRHDLVGALDAFGEPRRRAVDRCSGGERPRLSQQRLARHLRRGRQADRLPRREGADTAGDDRGGPRSKSGRSATCASSTTSAASIVTRPWCSCRTTPTRSTAPSRPVRGRGSTAASSASSCSTDRAPSADPPPRVWSATHLAVDATGPVHAGVDGEAVELDAPLAFVIRPGALRVRISSRHPGVSPSGRLP